MTIMPLTSWNVTKEAFQLVWRHKWLLGFSSIIPLTSLWAVIFIPGFFKMSNPLSFIPFMPHLERHTIEWIFFGLIFFSYALGARAWMKYILQPNQKPIIKSYFHLDTFFWLYLGYIGFLVWVTFYFPLIMIWIASAPFSLIVPAMAYGKPFSLLDIMKNTLPFWGKLLINFLIWTILMPIVGLILAVIPAGICANIIYPSQGVLSKDYFDEFDRMLDVMLFVGMGPIVFHFCMIMFITTITLYYKKGVLGQDQKL
jgi:hypothetical protein